MNIPMRVHRVSTHPIEVDVMFNGETARAHVPQMEVELVSNDGHGSYALRFSSSAEIAEAKTLFKHGAMVMMTFAAAGPEEISTEAVPAADAPDATPEAPAEA